MTYEVGTKVLLHSRGAGMWWPIEKHTVTQVTKSGTVYIDGLDKVPFKQDGQEAEPGSFKFRFYIEPEREQDEPRGSSRVSRLSRRPAKTTKRRKPRNVRAKG